MDRTAFVLLVACLGACQTSVHAPSAYEAVTYPCDDPAALASRISTCLASTTCAGVVGMKGRLGGNDIVVDSTLDTSTFDFVPPPDGSATQLDDVVGSGTAIFFFFDLAIESLGGAEDETITTPVVYQTARSPDLPDQYTDDIVDLGLTVVAAGESRLYEAVDGAAEMVLTQRSLDQLTGTFHGEFGAEAEELSGCFMQRATQRRVVSAQ